MSHKRSPEMQAFIESKRVRTRLTDEDRMAIVRAVAFEPTSLTRDELYERLAGEFKVSAGTIRRVMRTHCRR